MYKIKYRFDFYFACDLGVNSLVTHIGIQWDLCATGVSLSILSTCRRGNSFTASIIRGVRDTK